MAAIKFGIWLIKEAESEDVVSGSLMAWVNVSLRTWIEHLRYALLVDLLVHRSK